MIPCSLTTTDQFHFCHFSPNYLRDSCIIDWLISLKKHRILYQYQFGFRKNYSTFMALVTLLESITSALDNLEFSICILIDFRKAFDKVEHSILLNKLHHYGIRGTALQWFNSYLTNRYQYVNYNNTTSHMKQSVCGVPQGSILGPLLFLLYINDISSVSNVFSSVLFADDTTLLYSSNNLQELSATVNDDFSNIMQWLNANRLSLKTRKQILWYSDREVKMRFVRLFIYVELKSKKLIMQIFLE